MNKPEYETTNFLKGIKVLLSDDDKLTLKLVSDTLKVFGITNIFCTYTGKQLINALNSRKFDLIIMDWKIGNFDGCDFLTKLRHDEQAKNRFTPVILITGKGTVDEVRKARDSAITEFILKPFSVKKLREKLIEIVEKPRSFIISRNYVGPDRRRVNIKVDKDRRQKD
jgi:DNA-binding response OmpR family regulator